jgi:aldose sugar dehydrogenase
MKSPVVLVTAALAVAILLAASFLIATGTRGEDAPGSISVRPAGRTLVASPPAK